MARGGAFGADRPADPKIIVQGMGVWLAFSVLRRFLHPFAWIKRNIARLIFGWRSYPQYLREQSVVEGVLNGSKLWLTIGAGVWGLRALRRATGGSDRVVLREALQPGEQIDITQVTRLSSRQRRKAARRPG